MNSLKLFYFIVTPRIDGDILFNTDGWNKNVAVKLAANPVPNKIIWQINGERLKNASNHKKYFQYYSVRDFNLAHYGNSNVATIFLYYTDIVQ